jgi:condensin complex subunit 1
MALVEIVGCLIRELAGSDDITTDTAQTCKQVANFYDLLLDRMLDLSTYVRTKVLAVFVKLCEMPVKFPEQRLAMTRVATVALEDKAAGVRKGAIALIMKLIQTHPFGMHGGMLGLREWEDRYHGLKAELKKLGQAAGNAVDAEHDEAGAVNDEEDRKTPEEGIEDAEGDGTPTQSKK